VPIPVSPEREDIGISTPQRRSFLFIVSHLFVGNLFSRTCPYLIADQHFGFGVEKMGLVGVKVKINSHTTLYFIT